jgi:hypothetical protein
MKQNARQTQCKPSSRARCKYRAKPVNLNLSTNRISALKIDRHIITQAAGSLDKTSALLVQGSKITQQNIMYLNEHL